MTAEDIEQVIDDFRAAAERALDAGFEIAEVHAAHGYLLHEFLSPVTNSREDDYGGSFENRTRLVREVTAAVREVWPDDKPVFVRISATDWLPDRESWDVEQSARLAPLLADAGADLIDVSAGGIHPDQQVPEPGPGYQVPYAERVGENTDVAVGAVGKITEPEQADEIIRNGRADLAILAREHLRNPYFSLEAAHELDEDVEWPVQYQRGTFE
jgi:2,4-dienoyl-CoA reductase-like NADH-dependent reductase (Old Yellow Enzyme family)